MQKYKIAINSHPGDPGLMVRSIVLRVALGRASSRNYHNVVSRTDGLTARLRPRTGKKTTLKVSFS